MICCSKAHFMASIQKQDDRSSFVNKNVPARSKPVYHQGVDSPLCQKCRDLNLSFFDPQCPGCSSILQNPRTTVSQIFAIIRQWMPQVQKNIGMLIREMLKKGCNVNDRDGLTDMTMLHYASKSGAILNLASASIVGMHIAACITLCCIKWQGQMKKLAGFFNVSFPSTLRIKEWHVQNLNYCKLQYVLHILVLYHSLMQMNRHCTGGSHQLLSWIICKANTLYLTQRSKVDSKNDNKIDVNFLCSIGSLQYAI